jgi:hypothetical protein
MKSRRHQGAFVKSAVLVAILAVVSLGVAYGLFVGEEDWRGRHAWEAEKARITAEGQSLDVAAFSPPPVAPDANFMADPFLEQLLVKLKPDEVSSSRFARFYSPELQWLRGQPMSTATRYLDFSALGPRWEAHDHISAGTPQDMAERILAEMEPLEPDIRRLRAEALSKPASVLPDAAGTAGSAGDLPPIGGLNTFADTLRLQCAAEIELGRRDDAFADARIEMRLSEALRRANLIMATMVDAVIQNGAVMAAFGAGWERRMWASEQYALFREYFARNNPWADLPQAIEGERALDLAAYAPKLPWWAPQGEADLSRAGYGRAFDRLLADFGPDGRFNLADLKARLQSEKSGGGRWFGAEVRRVETSLDEFAAAMANTAHSSPMAETVAALELYRGKTGHYPATLTDLIPNFLTGVPITPATGEPFAYRLLNKNHFQLSSEHWTPAAKPPEWTWKQ